MFTVPGHAERGFRVMRHKVMRQKAMRHATWIATIFTVTLGGAAVLSGCNAEERGAEPAESQETSSSNSDGEAADDSDAGQSAGESSSAAGDADDEYADFTPPTDRQPGAPPVRIEPQVLDFGIAGPNEDLAGEVTLHNDGDEPLMIAAARPTCLCTTVDMSGEIIPPGGSINMPVGLKTSAAPGERPAQIRLAFHGYEESLTAGVTAEVALAVRAQPPYINAVGGNPLDGELEIESRDGRPFSICATGGKEPDIVDFDPDTDEPRSSYRVRYDISDYSRGEMPFYWVIETDHPEAPVVDVRIRHNWTRFQPNLAFQSFRGLFGEVVAGESGEFVMDIDGLHQHPVESVTSNSDLATTEIIEQSKSDEGMTTVRVRVTPDEEVRGLLYFQATFRVRNVTERLDVIGRVVDEKGQGCDL